MIRELEYQAKVLRIFDAYVEELERQKQNAAGVVSIAQANPNIHIPIPDFARETFVQLGDGGLLPPSRDDKPFSPRFDPLQRPVPNVVFKIPTAGGKTYLATLALSRIFGGYLGANTGSTLWIVPSEAIYTQTLEKFSDRQHPYRQIVDRAAAGRVLILEKNTPFSKEDVEQNLCIMFLMLQSANRRSKELLKMF